MPVDCARGCLDCFDGMPARQPAIVDIQILRVGQLVILCVPGEFTTMAGRRIKQAIRDQVLAPLKEFCKLELFRSRFSGS